MKVVVLTAIPSPYQVELFDAVTRLGAIEIHVIYLWRQQPSRPWAMPDMAHKASFVDELSQLELSAITAAADLVVFGWYQQRGMRELMKLREAGSAPWCFWGEAPGYCGLGFIGVIARQVLLKSLHRSTAAIWGIGSWAVDKYRAEFGSGRAYFNVPYFSDLARFACEERSDQDHPRTVLYSGALIRRKGVDVLARAWLRVAQRTPEARLEVLGNGPMRKAMERILEPLSDRVIFHGAKGWSALPSYYRRADILCAPSRYDGWGLVVPEALASAMPVIASNRMGASREMIREGENGWLCEPANEEQLAACLRRALTLPSPELRRMQQIARNTAEAYDVTQGAMRFVAAVKATFAQA